MVIRKLKPIIVRRAGLKDAVLILPLFEAYRRFYRRPSALKEAGRFIRARLSRRESVVFMALDGTQCLGFVQLYPSFSSTAMRRLWILNDLFVIPEARRRGVAQLLMERARRFSADTKAVGLALETATGNKPAQRLYERLGWKKDFEFYRYELDT